MSQLKNDFECNGGHVFMRNTCINIDAKDGLFEVLIKDDNMKIEYKVLTPILINCGGLYAARIFNSSSQDMSIIREIVI